MRVTDLSRTGSFRQTMLFLALFGFCAVLLFIFLYIQTHQFITSNVDDWLRREAAGAASMSATEVGASFDGRTAGDRTQERMFAILGSNGRWIAGDPAAASLATGPADQPFKFTITLAGRRIPYRGVRHRLVTGEVVLVAQNMHEAREFDEAFIHALMLGGALTAALGLLGAMIVGAGTVRRLDAVARTIRHIVSGDLSHRLPSHGTAGDLDRLTSVVNGMLDDIESLMHDVKGVCDGIAHDLRTPLTRILAGLERAQRRAATPEEYAAAVDDAIGEMRGVLTTFSALLRIAELEDGARRVGFLTVNLHDIARDVAEFYEPVAEEKELRLQVMSRGVPPFAVTGDPSLLFDAIANLVDNAIKFTPAGGDIVVRVERSPASTSVSVQDTGCGIAAADRDAVTRRFYRAARSRHEPGNGLGLSLVAAVARLHNMTLSFADTAPGCRVMLRHFAEENPSEPALQALDRRGPLRNHAKAKAPSPRIAMPRPCLK